ncbi:MAG TPA: hypothetical protein VEI57_06910 [Nitrospirota bacterium]|nr:hypothetical protein [Nitrospirota bacterium]
MPLPRLVVACGDCAHDRGIFRDYYAVTNGWANVIPVDCYIPGCPPTPISILLGLFRLIDQCVK